VFEIIIEFDSLTQSLGALREAAYRIIHEASCQIRADGDRYACHLTAKQVSGSTSVAEAGLREKFLDLVTDENLREKVAAETHEVRNVILALAFGALAAKQDDAGPA
jgi:His-Xaa-Ser system protein HxsD